MARDKEKAAAQPKPIRSPFKAPELPTTREAVDNPREVQGIDSRIVPPGG